MQLADFIKANLDQTVTAPGGLGGQCVDLANLYLMQVLRVPLVRANAIEWRNVTIRGFAWTENGPTNAPRSGSLVVWRPDVRIAIGAEGHIAIAIIGSANRFLSVDQNWPRGAPVRLSWHNYDGVLGWQSPP